MTTSEKIRSSKGSNGYFVLENKRGEVVRIFRWESSQIFVVYRYDNRRVETFRTLTELIENDIPHKVLAETTPSELKKSGLKIGQVGSIRYVEGVDVFGPEYDLPELKTLDTRTALGWSAIGQFSLIGILLIVSALTSTKQRDVTVTLISPEQVQEMLKQPVEMPKPAEVKQAEIDTPPPTQPVAAAPQRPQKEVIVHASETKITKHTPIPTKSTSFKKNARIAKSNKVRGGGYRSNAPRGYGTNERDMNSIGALGALNKRGNGGSGGVNLQAVGTEEGSGAGGRGFGGFGNNGGGGKGRGGIGRGRGQGLANAMYGKGLIAAPFGEGSPAPGSGGYGTRGKAGGGARGAGYGSETVVGSWKGTGPRGFGPAGSGSGSGDEYGSPWGSAEGDDGNAIVTGGLDMDAVRAVIDRNMGQIRYCYEQGMQKKSSLGGRVTMRWNIGASGSVTTSRVAHSSVRSAQVEGCINSKLRNWRFPRPHGGVTVAVTYPFILTRMAQR